jgi:hypothetical protein
MRLFSSILEGAQCPSFQTLKAMLPESLNTNQVKNAAGTEVEFIHKAYANDGSKRIYASTAEVYNLWHRLHVAHQDLGTGVDKRRRSMNQVLLEILGASGVKRKIVGTLSLDIPVGDLANQDGTKLVMANLLSFNASLGASTTILYDCTGSGAVAILDGSL